MENKQTENTELVPRLRFPGFEGEWEEILLSNCLSERNEQFPESPDYPLMAFVAGKGVSPKGEKFDRSALVKDSVNKKYKRTELNDFIYSSNNLESGSIGINTYGSACISPVYSIFKSRNNVDSIFIGTLLTQKSFISEMVKYRQGVVYGQWKIPEKDFLGMKVFIPSLSEQQKIASCLSELDNLISAQAQKVESLKTHKKGLMQQLFPQPGESIPRLRFPGFEGEWQEKKLGEIGSFVRGLSFNKTEVTLDTSAVLVIRSNNIIQDGAVDCKNGLQYVTKSPADEQILRKGDIVICLANGSNNLVGKTSSFEGGYKGIATVGAFCGIYRSSMPICKYLVQTSVYKDRINVIKQGGNGALANLYGRDILGLDFYFPTLAEQQKIASCLSALDDLIASESAKLDSLKDLKKGLMQQLFPQPTK